MSVFSKVSGFFSRHRNKFVVGGVLITSTIFLTRYAQQRLKEWQEKEALEFLETNRKRQHFESVGRTCNQTILNVSANLHEVVAKTINTEEVIEKLRENPEDKYELWNEIKFLVFTKAACWVYSSVMLVTTLKLQLSIVGGYLYKDPNSLSSDKQEVYLSLCQNLLNEGFVKLVRVIEKSCRKVLEPVTLKKELKLSDTEALFWSIQTSIASDDEDPIENLRKYFIPEIPNENGIYAKVICDTVDLLNSDEVKAIATQCVSRGFMLLSEQLSEFYLINSTEKPSSSMSNGFSNPFNERKPMAKLLPILNGLFAKKSTPDRLLQQLISFEKLQVLSANVYECLL